MSQSPVTRNSLILRLRNHGDADAWHEFVEIYEPLVYRMMTRSGLQPADAAEQVQEVMSAVAQAINRWEPDQKRGQFRSWLYRVSKNILADFWKKNSKNPVASLTGDSPELVDESTLPQEAFDLEFQEQVFVVVAKKVRESVSPKTWSAFWLSTVDRLSVEQVAKNCRCRAVVFTWHEAA